MTILSISGGSLDAKFNAALTTLKKTYAKLGFGMYANTLLDEIAIVDAGGQGAKTQLGMLIDSTGYRLVPLTSSTKYTENPPKIIAECGYARMDLWGIQWAKLADDLSKQMLLSSMPNMAGKPVMAPVLEVLKLLQSNPTCLYDDLPFFHASHLSDPYDSGGPTFPNLITEPLTTAGWNAFLNKVIQRKDPGSKAATKRLYLPNRGLNGSNMRIWVGSTSVFTALDKIFDPRSLFETATGMETRKTYAQCTMQLVPEMSMDASYENYVYVLLNNTPNRGVFARIPHAPTIDETREGGDVEVDCKVRNVNAYQTWGATLADPGSLYKWQFS